MVDAEIIATHHKSAFKRLTDLILCVEIQIFLPCSGPRIITVPEDSRPGSLLGFFLISNNEGAHRGVSCYLKQVNVIEIMKSSVSDTLFQISPLSHRNISMFTVRKELTPSANGDTKCSVYLQKKLDYEKYASYIMQIIAEVKSFSYV